MKPFKCTYQLTINPAACKVLIEKGYPKCKKCPRRAFVPQSPLKTSDKQA